MPDRRRARADLPALSAALPRWPRTKARIRHESFMNSGHRRSFALQRNLNESATADGQARSTHHDRQLRRIVMVIVDRPLRLLMKCQKNPTFFPPLILTLLNTNERVQRPRDGRTAARAPQMNMKIRNESTAPLNTRIHSATSTLG